MGGNRVTIKQGLIEIVADTTVDDTSYAPQEVWALPAVPTMAALVVVLEAQDQVSRSGVRVTFPGKLPGSDAVAWALEWVSYQGAEPVPLVWNVDQIANPSALNNLYLPVPNATFRARLMATEPGKKPVRYPEATIATSGDTALSDNVLSAAKKPAAILSYSTITGEQAGIDAQAVAFTCTAVDAAKATYDAAVTALTAYLGTLTGWNVVPGSDVVIVGATYRAKFTDVTTARQALLNAVSAQAKALADAANAGVGTINDPDTLGKDEKPQILQDYATLTGENADLVAKATSFGVSHSAYDTAYTALVTTYLPTLTSPVLWSLLTGNTALGAGNRVALWNPKWLALRSAANDLKAAIASGAFAQANAAAATAATANSTAVTAAANAPLIVTGLPTLPNATYPANKLVYDNTTKRLYRSMGSAWEASTTDAGDLTGTLAAARVAVGSLDAKISVVDAAKLTTGTLDVARIATNALDQSKIASLPTTKLTGTITADQLAANSVLARNMTLMNFENLIPNPNSEIDPATLPAGVLETVGVTASWAYQGTRCRSVPGSASQTTLGLTNFIPVFEGEKYYCAGMVSARYGTTGTVYLVIRFYDSTGTYLPAYTAATTAINGATWLLSDAVVAVPSSGSGAVFMTVELYTNLLSTAGDYGRADNLVLRRMADANLIVDGAITTQKMTAGTINADRLTADSITATQIAANAVTASELAANAVVAGKIQAGTIVAADIAASTITGAKIAAATITAGNIAADTITAGQIAAGAIGASEVAAYAITAKNMVVTNFENLVPNPNSEAPAPSGGWPAGSFEGAGLYSSVAYVGSYCRCASGGEIVQLTPLIPVSLGEMFYFEGYIRTYGSVGVGTGFLHLRAYDQTQSSNGLGIVTNQVAGSADSGWVFVSGILTVTSNTAFVALELYGGTLQVGTGRLWGDNFLLKRMSDGKLIVDGAITANKLEVDLATANVIRSSNWDGSSSVQSTTGYKVSGTWFTAKGADGSTATVQADFAAATMMGGYLVGGLTARAMSAIGDNGATGTSFRCWYRGNNDATNSGAPTIASSDANPASTPRLLINSIKTEATAGPSLTHLVFQVQPQSASDNLDGLSYIEVECWYRAGTNMTKTQEYFPVAIRDRRWRVPGTDTDSGNMAKAGWTYVDRSTTVVGLLGATNYLILKCRIVNAVGESTEHYFTPPSAAGTGSSSATGRWTDVGTAAPLTGGGSGGTGGGGGGGGACPDPAVPLRMADGSEKPAGQIRVGDLVAAWDEAAGCECVEEVIQASLTMNQRWLLRLSNGCEGRFAANHRFLLPGGQWQELQRLAAGNVLEGGLMVEVAMPDTFGPVVKITVNRVHTYITLGVVSHNVKIRTI